MSADVQPHPVRRLPDALVNKIAAGEVVERPASVVKELVENSLDAASERITIAIRGAGRQLISVVDDGHGMTHEDCRLALERHATSKLADEADLAAIATLGFRGEALPAIFAVSRLRLASRVRGQPRGYLILGEGGVVHESGEADVPEGTAVEARDLFFNTPARAKFLKSPPTEQAAVLRVVTQLALAHPQVHIRLTANGRAALNAPRAATLRDRLGGLYGFGLSTKLLEVAAERGSVRLAGLVAPPPLARTHREDIHLIVNGRAVRDTLLTQALVEAYRPLLPRDAFPLAVLVLTVEPADVDVNVHPSKTWVRFRHPRALHDLVYEAVAQALRQLDVVPARGLAGSFAEMLPALAGVATGSEAAADASEGQVSLFRDGEAGYQTAPLFGQPIGQIEDTFIVAYTPEEVFFIDQHVAHERVLFERLRSDLDAGPLPGQDLLFPAPLELAPARLRTVERLLPELTRLGFALEDFGGGTLLLRAVPSLLRDDEPQRLVDDLAREIEDEGTRAGSPVFDRLLAFVACRAAIKAHQPLPREEMTRLLHDLAATARPFYCPHGRPVVSRIALREIKRDLRRTW
ncbi:MAG: DNA mismatch repair endonuclease MutL [Candidatus Rokubacteria bacterium]|nr:DNA mismatch repair endonuclease MutL [Candidatus Rokubacteria bacterium]